MSKGLRSSSTKISRIWNRRNTLSRCKKWAAKTTKSGQNISRLSMPRPRTQRLKVKMAWSNLCTRKSTSMRLTSTWSARSCHSGMRSGTQMLRKRDSKSAPSSNLKLGWSTWSAGQRKWAESVSIGLKMARSAFWKSLSTGSEIATVRTSTPVT